MILHQICPELHMILKNRFYTNYLYWIGIKPTIYEYMGRSSMRITTTWSCFSLEHCRTNLVFANQSNFWKSVSPIPERPVYSYFSHTIHNVYRCDYRNKIFHIWSQFWDVSCFRKKVLIFLGGCFLKNESSVWKCGKLVNIRSGTRSAGYYTTETT